MVINRSFPTYHSGNAELWSQSPLAPGFANACLGSWVVSPKQGDKRDLSKMSASKVVDGVGAGGILVFDALSDDMRPDPLSC